MHLQHVMCNCNAACHTLAVLLQGTKRGFEDTCTDKAEKSSKLKMRKYVDGAAGSSKQVRLLLLSNEAHAWYIGLFVKNAPQTYTSCCAGIW